MARNVGAQWNHFRHSAPTHEPRIPAEVTDTSFILPTSSQCARRGRRSERRARRHEARASSSDLSLPGSFGAKSERVLAAVVADGGSANVGATPATPSEADGAAGAAPARGTAGIVPATLASRTQQNV
jgi:hypothetical protein